MRFAERLDRVPPYLFVEISRKIAAKKAEGINVISFGLEIQIFQPPTGSWRNSGQPL